MNKMNKKFNPIKIFDKIEKKKQKKIRTTCFSCRLKCLYIGTKNSRGQYKDYCCDCYSKLDQYFIPSKWCKKCKKVNLQNIKMKHLEKQFVPISYVVELLQNNCNYSPKMCFIEITNMLKISKEGKEI
jgi:hypothetical protein